MCIIAEVISSAELHFHPGFFTVEAGVFSVAIVCEVACADVAVKLVCCEQACIQAALLALHACFKAQSANEAAVAVLINLHGCLV